MLLVRGTCIRFLHSLHGDALHVRPTRCFPLPPSFFPLPSLSHEEKGGEAERDSNMKGLRHDLSVCQQQLLFSFFLPLYKLLCFVTVSPDDQEGFKILDKRNERHFAKENLARI